MGTNHISADHVAKQLRLHGATFLIKGTVYPKNGEPLVGEGIIRLHDDEFILELTFATGVEPPQMERGIYRRSDFWRFEGVIGTELVFVAEHLVPDETTRRLNAIVSQTYTTQTISFPAQGLDGFTIDTIASILAHLEKEAEANNGQLPDSFSWKTSETESMQRESTAAQTAPENEGAIPSEPEIQPPSPYSDGVWIHALVRDFPLIHKNGETEFLERNSFLGESTRVTVDTFSGNFEGIKFGLVQRNSDLDVYLHISNQDYKTATVGSLERLSAAFLTGLAFATGQDCLPYRLTIRRDGALLLERLHAVKKADRSALSPFSERIGFNTAIGQIEWEFADFLGKATHFFNSDSELSNAASQALWLLRSSDAKNVPSEITLMSICVLLESLAGMIFEDKELSSSQDSETFEESRKELLNWIEDKKPENGSGLQRFQNMITSARLLRPKDKYKAVSDHFNLPWNGLMNDAWTIWEKVRNKGAHDILRKEQEHKIDTKFTAIGRIAGAINVLILRLIGYSGIARTSVFEDRHHNI